MVPKRNVVDRKYKVLVCEIDGRPHENGSGALPCTLYYDVAWNMD